jgi:hypothetical protein
MSRHLSRTTIQCDSEFKSDRLGLTVPVLFETSSGVKADSRRCEPYVVFESFEATRFMCAVIRISKYLSTVVSVTDC